MINIQNDHTCDVPQSLMPNEYDRWKVHWQALGQPWRTEPEIEAKRQEELGLCYVIVPDIKQGRYPFSSISSKLERADIEWLLATPGADPACQCEKHQFAYPGLDLRGVDLSKVDLRGLPLMHIRGGLSTDEWCLATTAQRDMAAVHLERADLREAHLEGAMLRGAHLEGADLRATHLEGTDLRAAHLEGKGHALKPLPPADLRMAFLDKRTCLQNSILGDERHGVIKVADIHWEDADLASMKWNQVNRLGDETDAQQWKDLDSYRAAVRANRQLAGALYAQGLNEEAKHFAYRAHVNQRVIWRRKMLLPLLLRLFKEPHIPLPLVFRRLKQWQQSQRMQQNILPALLMRMSILLLIVLLLALLAPLVLLGVLLLGILAFLSLYLLLRRRGRLPRQHRPTQTLLLPQVLLPQRQRRWQTKLLILSFLLRKPPVSVSQSLPTPRFPGLLLFLLMLDNTLVCGAGYLFSLVLDVLVGYGYKPARCLVWYAITLIIFATLYFFFGYHSPVEALVLSITSFHGRGFLPSNIAVSNPIVLSAAIESIIGLVIEISFVVTVIRSCLSKRQV